MMERGQAQMQSWNVVLSLSNVCYGHVGTLDVEMDIKQLLIKQTRIIFRNKTHL